ncbi:MAG: signal transduction histidine kinase with CheB and CheR, partial [Paenibacillaceae bacterium]|nr:signal transduction histidine kinase with CheB and CheR [Paenibacillaceae bacterium]
MLNDSMKEPGSDTPAALPASGPAQADRGPLYIVGIGASAGGLEALEQFFDYMPSDSEMAFIVVQHLSPDHKSLMAHILSKNTRMRIHEAEDGMRIEANHVYLNPPRKNLTLGNGHLQLKDALPKPGLHLPIDLFFRSLAAACGPRAISIVLSGTGSDGSRGVIAVKEAGGLVLVQDSHSAKFDGMPNSAVMTGNVDWVHNPQQIAERLLQHAGLQYPSSSATGNLTVTITIEQYIQLIFDRIKQESGIDFTYYKRNSVMRRIERRMTMINLQTIADYLVYLENNKGELQALRKDLLIGVTNFFRDPQAFQSLYEKVLPSLFVNRAVDKEVRVWVAGCSTGEEAYSIAILLRKYIDSLGIPYTVKIFATDLDKESIEYASQGIYSESIIPYLSNEDVERYFILDDGVFQISKDIRKMIIFAPHNIIKDPPFSNLDLVTCRNMLIYLQPEMQYKVLSLFHFALTPEGHLFLGPSETLGRFSSQFQPVDRHWNIFSHRNAKQLSAPELLDSHNRFNQQFVHPRYDRAVPSIRGQHSHKKTDAMHVVLSEEHMAPCLVIDHNNDVVHLNGEVNEYLTLAQGKPSWNLFKMVDSTLSVAIFTAIQKVRREKQQMVYRALKINTKQGQRIVDLIIKPFSLTHSSYEKHILVLFEEQKEQPVDAIHMVPVDMETTVSLRIMELEHELQQAEERLQATIEELETSNEELQSTNEELVSANEELQSANEELQSVNEELVTVNTEFQFKIQELTDLNNDMSNFLASTRIGTIFLDKRMCIRRFTPAITKEINLMEVDYGRPITHISHQFKHDTLVEDAQNVLQTLIPLEREIQSKSGSWYSMRILPYRTEDSFVNGVVLTFVDITTLKSVNEELTKLFYAIEQSPSITIITDVTGAVEYVNPQFTAVTGYGLEEVMEQKLDSLSLWDETAGGFSRIMKQVTSGETWTGELKSRAKNRDYYWELAKIIPIKNDRGGIIQFLKLSEDITGRKQTEEMLRKTEMLSAVGQLAAGIAHEIRNPLTALKGFTKLITTTGSAKSNYMDIMLDELNRIEQIVSELLVLAKPQAVDFAVRDVGNIIGDVLMLLESQANMNNVEMAFEAPLEPLKVLCVENQLKQVFINVVKNAIEAMADGGRIEVLAFLGTEQQITLRFQDTGGGIPEGKL